VQRRASKKPLGSLEIDDSIVERYYQQRAIRAIGEHFEVDKQRRALLVMATGAGKTRTVVALTDLLMKANLVKRVLFLADRQELVKQAVNAFKTHLPDSAPVNLLTEGNVDGRVYVSTYPTMMGKIDEYRPDGPVASGWATSTWSSSTRLTGRCTASTAPSSTTSTLLVGLTATPKDEVDKNTYGLFDLETGVPTDAYALDDAVADGHLVPPVAMSVPLKFLARRGQVRRTHRGRKGPNGTFDWTGRR
jgi:type I restriction enzyme R subunit